MKHGLERQTFGITTNVGSVLRKFGQYSQKPLNGFSTGGVVAEALCETYSQSASVVFCIICLLPMSK